MNCSGQCISKVTKSEILLIQPKIPKTCRKGCFSGWFCPIYPFWETHSKWKGKKDKSSSCQETTQCLLKNCSALTCQSFIKALVVPAEKDIWSWRRVANCCPLCKVSLQCDQPSVSLGGVVGLKLRVLNCQPLKKSQEILTLKYQCSFFPLLHFKNGKVWPPACIPPWW